MESQIQFKPHGRGKIQVEGRVIRRFYEGPWNREFVIQAHDELGHVANFDFSQPWVNMIVVEKSALCPLDALEAINKNIHSELNKHRIATAWVYPPGTEGSDIMIHMLRPLYEDRLPVAFFSTIEDADQWLLEVLKLSDLSNIP